MEPARRASQTAAAPEPPEDGELFLTPRVIDRRTFEDYAALLRQSIAEAASESELLARRAEAAAVVLDQLERFMGDNGDAIERAAEILTDLDDRSCRLDALLVELDRRASAADKIGRDAEAAAAD
ncbi:MAG: hypothetical protein AAGF47_11735, partial [Planctomycetota bacterium]